MHEHISILIVTLVILVYGYYSKSLLRYNISGPMVFTTIGVLLSPIGFSLINIGINTELVTTVAEIALIMILFSDASGLNIKELRKDWSIPTRLLVVGLPLTVLFAYGVAELMFTEELSIYLVLMALLLAPTDAALGKAVVSDKRVPEKIRSAINVESGLNDGIVFPILIGVLAIISVEQGSTEDTNWVLYILQQVVFGAIIGAAIGYLNALFSLRTIKSDKVEASYKNLIPIAIAILSYYVAEYFGGNGFIAAFCSGLFFGNYNEALRSNVENFVESEAELLVLISFMVFGVIFIPMTIDFWSFEVLCYSLLSLTFLRMLPVAISLIGLKLDLATVLFVGWFGPRGIASVLYVLIVVDKVLSITDHELIYSVVTITILLSIFLHGITSRIFVKMYAKNHK